MSQPHQDHSNCNHDHEHNHKAHDANDTHGVHDHDHVAVDPGEVIAEKSPQDLMLIGVCAIAMTLLMVCMGSWMQIPTPSGHGHGEQASHSESAHASENGTTSAQESHENQSH